MATDGDNSLSEMFLPCLEYHPWNPFTYQIRSEQFGTRTTLSQTRTALAELALRRKRALRDSEPHQARGASKFKEETNAILNRRTPPPQRIRTRYETNSSQ